MFGLLLTQSHAFRYGAQKYQRSTCHGLNKVLSMMFSTKSDYGRGIVQNIHDYADVYQFPMFDDNYGYILLDKESKMTVCVDPGDGDAVTRALNTLNLPNLDYILCTHKHMDHVGGNAILKQIYPDVEIIGTRSETIPLLDKGVGGGDVLAIGSLRVRVQSTPCHTAGHVVYVIDKPIIEGDSINARPPILFCGDTLFVGGCGRFFEGTAEQMEENMAWLRNELPNETAFYCAHEYTESNLRFLVSVDPEGTMSKYEEVRAKRAAQKYTVPSTLGDEKQYNLFMKCNEKRTQDLVGARSAQEAMAILRQMKNSF